MPPTLPAPCGLSTLCVFFFFSPLFCVSPHAAYCCTRFSPDMSALNKDVYFCTGSAATLAPPTLATIATLATTASSLRQLLLTPAGGRLLWQVFCCSCRLPMAPSGPLAKVLSSSPPPRRPPPHTSSQEPLGPPASWSAADYGVCD